MKCKVCGGTGTSNTCVNGTFKPCTFCDGTGEYEPFDADIELDKLYPTEQTNEEWFCQLPTGEKAHFLSVECARAMCEQQLKITNRNGVDYWKMWLKQPHTNKE